MPPPGAAPAKPGSARPPPRALHPLLPKAPGAGRLQRRGALELPAGVGQGGSDSWGCWSSASGSAASSQGWAGVVVCPVSMLAVLSPPCVEHELACGVPGRECLTARHTYGPGGEPGTQMALATVESLDWCWGSIRWQWLREQPIQPGRRRCPQPTRGCGCKPRQAAAAVGDNSGS